jgi:hypothetical protein
MATESLLTQAGIQIPKFQEVGPWVMYFMIAIVVAILLALIVFLVIARMKFNKKVILFKKVAGQIIPVFKDTAMLERIGLAGDTWLRTRKMKKILPRPKINMDKDTFWFYEREDGEWINFSLNDLDEDMKKADAYYVDEDMRLQRLGIQRNLKDRFDKMGFWDKYGSMIMMVIFMLIVTICLIVIFNKINDLVKALPPLAQALESLANAIKSNQTGMVAVTNSTGALL